jgi:hypothetical protein
MCSCFLSCMQVSFGKENGEQVIKYEKGINIECPERGRLI